jgi:imidazoleglycerol-phosphate dehydratase
MTTANRTAEVVRNTRETQISARVDLDGTGETDIECPIGFLAHMLDAFGRHAHVDLTMRIAGDLHIDQHHTVEDAGIVLGQALREALGDRRGIWRTGHCRFPMDETLAEAAVDLSGRPFCVFLVPFERAFIGELQSDLVVEFFRAFAGGLAANLHVELVRGENDHHRCEATFKAVARAFELAAARHPRASDALPSTKGHLDG